MEKRKRTGWRRVVQRGQSTVEFMLMVPVIFAMLFFVIEMGLYFSAVHYVHYAAFVTARSQMANFGGDAGDSAAQTVSTVASWVLTGSALKSNFSATSVTGGVQISIPSWKTNFPYLAALMPNMAFTTTVYLGPNEYSYEAVKPSGSSCADNDVDFHAC